MNIKTDNLIANLNLIDVFKKDIRYIYQTKLSIKHTPVKQKLSTNIVSCSNNWFKSKNIYQQTICLQIKHQPTNQSTNNNERNSLSPRHKIILDELTCR